jgi:hypothetical protein
VDVAELLSLVKMSVFHFFLIGIRHTNLLVEEFQISGAFISNILGLVVFILPIGWVIPFLVFLIL